MDLNKLIGEAEEFVNEHGGVSGLQQDATQIAGIVQGQGSLVDKAQEAVKVVQAVASTPASAQAASTSGAGTPSAEPTEAAPQAPATT